MKIKTFGYLALITGIVIVSFAPLAYKVGSNVPVFEFTLLIGLIGTIISALLMFATKTQGNISGILKNRNQMFALVSVGIFYAIITLIFAYATHYTSAGLLAVVYRTWPLMLVAIAPFALREKITKWDIIGMVIGFSSVAAVSLLGSAVGLPIYLLPIVGLVLIAAFSDAITSAIQKRFSYELYSSLFIYNLMSLIIFTALALYTGQFALSGMNTSDIYMALFIGVFQNVVASFCFVEALRILKTSFVGNAYNIAPFLTIVLSYAILNEVIQPAYLIIAFGVLAGLAVQKLAPRTASYISKSKRTSAMPAIYDITSAFVNTKNQKIYDVMKGNGRVLAFYVDDQSSQEAVMSKIGEESARGDGVVLMTNRTNSSEISTEEMDFIKEILGHQERDLVVLGIGEPDMVEKRFSELGELRKARTSSQ